MTNTACMTAGCFTSSSTYKPMLYLALARLPFSFRTVNL
jgi:glutathione S-transferase